MTMGCPGRQAGFTLVEILVAFAIATTSLALLFRIHSNSTTMVLLSEEYQKATALAQSLVAELSVTERALSFSKRGTDSKYSWIAHASPYPQPPSVADLAEPPFELRSMTVEVSWNARDKPRRILLETVKPFIGRTP